MDALVKRIKSADFRGTKLPAELAKYFAASTGADADVAAFHEKERIRWDVVYDETYVEAPQEFYPGDRVKIVSDVQIKRFGKVEIESAKGMQGTVTHYEFDDGYESCQTCSTACPVTVLLDEQVE